jgi:hypothetical protein
MKMKAQLDSNKEETKVCNEIIAETKVWHEEI